MEGDGSHDPGGGRERRLGLKRWSRRREATAKSPWYAARWRAVSPRWFVEFTPYEEEEEEEEEETVEDEEETETEEPQRDPTRNDLSSSETAR